jgi:hypothetical protein
MQEVNMSSQLKTALVLGTMLVGLGAGSARADEITANVPFPFTVNGHALPAGKYDVKTGEDSSSILLVQDVNERNAHVMVQTIGEYKRDPAGDKPVLSFVRDGDQYRLAAVWVSSGYGREIVGR